ncbi:MAG: hypothetical protein J7M21_05920 [Planctomycetes bacterium]|nr:hypothetical protein [Planctomycetota bacterium]
MNAKPGSEPDVASLAGLLARDTRAAAKIHVAAGDAAPAASPKTSKPASGAAKPARPPAGEGRDGLMNWLAGIKGKLAAAAASRRAGQSSGAAAPPAAPPAETAAAAQQAQGRPGSPATRPASEQAVTYVPCPPGFSFTGIVRQGGHVTANVNGRFVGVGQTVAGAKVVKITMMAVELQRGDKRFVVSFGRRAAPPQRRAGQAQDDRAQDGPPGSGDGDEKSSAGKSEAPGESASPGEPASGGESGGSAGGVR